MDSPSLAAYLADRSVQLKQLREQGKKIVGVFPGNYVPEELIWAAGAVPVCLVHGGDPIAAEEGLNKVPQVICPFARSLIGEVSLGRNPFYSGIDLLVAPITCQHLKKVAEIWEYEGALEVFKFGIPFQHGNDFELAYFAENIELLMAKLQSLTGNEITHQKLTDAIGLYNRLRELLKKISLLRKAENPSVDAREFYRFNHASCYLDPESMVELLAREYERLSGRTPDSKTAAGPRILLMGPNLAYGDDKVPQLIRDAGGQIVMEEFFEGIRHYWRPVGFKENPVQSLVQGYLVDRHPCSFMRNASRKRLEFVLDLVEEFNVTGVVWYELLCCETYDSEAFYFSKEMEKRDTPFLILESDYTASDIGQLKTRIEAFIEIVSGGIC